MIRLSDSDRQAIVAAFYAGEKRSDIAARFGVADTYPRKLARQAGIPPRSRSSECDEALARGRVTAIENRKKRASRTAEQRRIECRAAQVRYLDKEALACFERCIADGMLPARARYEALEDMAMRVSVAARKGMQ